MLALTPEEVFFYVSEVVVAIELLHSLDYIYWDLKLDNLMVSQTGHLKLIDFGFAIKTKGWASTVCGTPAYMAPELLLPRQKDE